MLINEKVILLTRLARIPMIKLSKLIYWYINITYDNVIMILEYSLVCKATKHALSTLNTMYLHVYATGNQISDHCLNVDGF